MESGGSPGGGEVWVWVSCHVMSTINTQTLGQEWQWKFPALQQGCDCSQKPLTSKEISCLKGLVTPAYRMEVLKGIFLPAVRCTRGLIQICQCHVVRQAVDMTVPPPLWVSS